MPTNKQLADYYDQQQAKQWLDAWTGRSPPSPIDTLMADGFAMRAYDPSLDQQEIQKYEASPKNSKTVQRFRAEMKNVFDTVPLVESKYNKGKTITLRQAVVEDFARQMKPLAEANAHADTILQQFTGDSRDDQIGRQVNMLLGRVAETVVPPAEYGPKAESFITMDKMDEWTRQARVNPDAPTPRFRLNEAGQKHWQQQRYYDFLRAMQDGPNAPPYATGGTGIQQALSVPLGIASYPLAMAALNYGNLLDPALNAAPTSDKYLQGQAENLRLAKNTLSDGVEGRMDSALYWLDRGKDAKATKDPITGANFPNRSMAATAGYSDNFYNYGNLLTRGNSPAEIPVRNLGTSLDSMVKIGRARADTQRDTPVMVDESFREKAKQAYSDMTEHQNLQQQWKSANYPRLVNWVNDTFGTGFTPSYLSPGAALFAELPSEMASDMQSVFGLGAASGKAALRGGFRALPSIAKNYAKELFMEEAPVEFAMSIPEEAGAAGPEGLQPDIWTYMTTPPRTMDALKFEEAVDPAQDAGQQGPNPLLDAAGQVMDSRSRTVHPLATDRPNYEKGLAAYNQRRSDLDKAIGDYQSSSAWAKAVRAFRSGIPMDARKMRHLRPTDKWTPSPVKAP